MKSSRPWTAHAAPSLRLRGRRLRLGLATLLGGRPRGFFLPYRYAASVRRTGYPLLEPVMEKATPAFLDALATIERFAPQLRSFAGPRPEPRWTQDWFPRLDGAAAYALLRTFEPRRIVEIGSGHSTRFLARAVRDGAFACDLVAIDPEPRASLEGLRVRHLPTLVERVDRALFRDLGRNDVLFVDSSHIVMPGTDVDLVVNHLLPMLAEGVLVHVHDVFLPDPYPASWTWRGYNEQSLVACLLHTGAYEPVFASHYAATRLAARLAESAVGELPLLPGAHETSLWLRKRIPPAADPAR